MLSRTTSKTVRPSGHDISKARHFLGQDSEILQETQSKSMKVTLMKIFDVLLFALDNYTTIVISVEEIRLFNSENVAAVRYRLPKIFSHSEEAAGEGIRQGHSLRLKLIKAITTRDSSQNQHGSVSQLRTVSFIPGALDHVEYGMHFLVRCWQEELSAFCATVNQNPNLRHVHIESKLCEGMGWSLALEKLLKSQLRQLSLPDMNADGWRNLASRLAWTETLRVLTVRCNTEGMETFLQTPVPTSQGDRNWTDCNTMLQTVWISCPRGVDATTFSMMLGGIYRVQTFVIESPPESAPSLLRFASSLGKALVDAPNVRELHLLVPIAGAELSELIPKLQMLWGVVLVLDMFTKKDLKAVSSMIQESQTLRFFGIRYQNPKKERSAWQWIHRITEVDVLKFLAAVGKSNLQTLSLRGWDLVNGKNVLKALIELLGKRPQLDIDLTCTGLDLKNKLEPVIEILQKRKKKTDDGYRGGGRGGTRTATSGRTSSSHHASSSSGPTGTTGSSLFERPSTIVEHGEKIGWGPGSIV